MAVMRQSAKGLGEHRDGSAGANPAAIRAHVAHEPEAADAATGVAAKIDDETVALEIGDRAADVARDVHPEDAGEHVDAGARPALVEDPGVARAEILQEASITLAC